MKRAKRLICFLMSAVLCFCFFGLSPVEGAYKPTFDVNSQYIYMVNTDTDTVVFSKNEHERTYPASLTKIMTAIIALEKVKDLEGTVVTAPAYIYNEFAGANVSTADIRKNEEVRMIDLLYAMILQSSCEASSIIADYVGEGSIPAFVQMMNDKAKEIGALETQFTNAHGLYDDLQYTTAYDMYLITKYALDNFPIFETIATSQRYLMPQTNIHSERYIVHTNNMLSKNLGGDMYYQYVRGIKTGSLDQIGKNLVSLGSKDGYNYLLVTIGAPTKNSNGEPLGKNGSYEDAINLYEWAFDYFKEQVVLEKGQIVTEVPVSLSAKQDYVTLVASKEVTSLLPKDVDITAIKYVSDVKENVTAPIAKGETLGKLQLNLADEVIAEIDLIAFEDVERSSFLYGVDIVKRFLAKPVIKLLLVLLVVLIILYIIFSLSYRNKKRRQRRSNRTRKINY